jgi:hypothetical protein
MITLRLSPRSPRVVPALHLRECWGPQPKYFALRAISGQSTTASKVLYGNCRLRPKLYRAANSVHLLLPSHRSAAVDPVLPARLPCFTKRYFQKVVEKPLFAHPFPQTEGEARRGLQEGCRIRSCTWRQCATMWRRLRSSSTARRLTTCTSGRACRSRCRIATLTLSSLTVGSPARTRTHALPQLSGGAQ